MAVSTAEFLKRLEASQILAEAELQEVRRQVPPAELTRDAESFVKQQVKDQRITAYQARRLWKNQGRSLLLGNYVIADELGRGGMGVVLKAVHRRMDRKVAVKVLPSAMVKDQSAIARFQREVIAAAQLTHPNIVAAFDADQINGQHILVMEFVDGRDLSSIVKKSGPVTIDQAIDCLIQAARGLEYAHERGVIHRDIKPANLLLDSEGTVKILDMGLARFSESANVGEQAELTGTGAVMGTIDYMSPEQALNSKSADARSDIYSLGITLYFLLTGQPAYSGDSLMARLMAHTRSPIPSLQTARPEVPANVQAVFEKMVAKKPEERYQTMGEVIRDLETCRTDRTGTALVATAPVSGSASESGNGGSLTEFLNSLEEEDSGPVAVGKATARRSSAGAGDSTIATSSTSGTLSVLSRSSSRGATPGMLTSAGNWWRDWRVLSGVAGVVLVLAVAMMSRKDSVTVTAADDQTSENNTSGSTSTGGSRRPAEKPVTAPAEESTDAPKSIAEYALEFNVGWQPGERHEVTAPTLLDVTPSVTLECWTQRNDARKAPHSEILGFGGKRRIRTGSGPFFWPNFEIDQDFVRPFDGVGWTAGIDSPSHLAFVRDAEGNEIRFYVDGKHVGSFPGLDRGYSPLQICSVDHQYARGQPGGGPRYVGWIDEVRISDTPRYTSNFTPVRRFEPDEHTLALYHFDEGSGDTLTDSSGNKHHGRINGARWVQISHGIATPVTRSAGRSDGAPDQSRESMFGRRLAIRIEKGASVERTDLAPATAR